MDKLRWAKIVAITMIVCTLTFIYPTQDNTAITQNISAKAKKEYTKTKVTKKNRKIIKVTKTTYTSKGKKKLCKEYWYNKGKLNNATARTTVYNDQNKGKKQDEIYYKYDNRKKAFKTKQLKYNYQGKLLKTYYYNSKEVVLNFKSNQTNFKIVKPKNRAKSKVYFKYTDMNNYMLFKENGYKASSYNRKKANDIVKKINKTRKAKNRKTLKTNKKLQRIADQRAKDLIDGYVHFRPNGASIDTLARRQGLKKGIGENINQYVGQDFTIKKVSANQIHKDWYNSASHRSNILYKKYKQVAVSVYEDYWTDAVYAVTVYY